MVIQHIFLFIYISSFGQIAQWLECVHGKHKVMGSNPTRAYLLYGIEKPWLKMNTIYIGKFCYTPIINSKYKFETLVRRLMKGPAQN